MKELIDKIYYTIIETTAEKETAEYRLQKEKTLMLYHELRALLNDDCKEKLRVFSSEESYSEAISNSESFKKGFRTAFSLVFQSIVE